jgi:phage shock protein PspC (stress-responsive transcriptional regulator)
MAQSVFTREDTFFGVCFAIGTDLGFNPTWLRVLFAFLFFWSPATAAAVYAGCGALVALSRWLVPEPGGAAAGAGDSTSGECEPEDLKLAA